MIITELKGNSHVFNLADKSTFRIFSRETKKVKDGLISDEMKLAEKMGLILMTKEEVKSHENVVKLEHPIKKSGGTK